MIEAHYILRYGVITGLVILIAGLLISILTEITTILWLGIYIIIATPLLSVALICIRNIRSKERGDLGLLALLEIVVVMLYILIILHVL